MCGGFLFAEDRNGKKRRDGRGVTTVAGIRALQRRIKRVEEAKKPRPSPFTVLFGSFDAWVETQILPGIESGALDERDMIEIVAALRVWEGDGTWDHSGR